MNLKLILILFFAVLPFAGCNHKGAGASSESRAGNDDKAIASAIQAHLAHKGTLDVRAFDTQVKQVSYDGDHAKALVEFHVKKGPGVMQLTYALARTNNVWAVVESKPMGSDFSHPPLDKGSNPGAPAVMKSTAGATNGLDDRFRGDIGAAPAALPPGHPPVDPTPQQRPPK